MKPETLAMVSSPYRGLNGWRWPGFLAWVTLMWLVGGPPAAQALPAVFTIDPSQSYVTLSAKLVGLALVEQSPGSLTTTLTGTVNAELTSATIRFPGLSSVYASTNGPWQPLPGGLAGAAPADFGAKGEVASFGTIQIAVRNIVLDLESEAIPLNNGGFDDSQVRFVVSTNRPSAFDYAAGLLGAGSRMVAGVSTNQVPAQATLTDAAKVQTLQLAIDTQFAFSAFITNDSMVSFRGKIVATRPLENPIVAPPVVRSISIENDRVVVRGGGEAGQPHRLESCRALPDWTACDAVISVDGTNYVFTTDKADSREFYRMAR